MLRNMLVGALIAGFAAGLIAVALQMVFLQPLLLEAELYESGDRVHFGAADPSHGDDGHTHADGWAASFQRDGLTFLFGGLIYVGYALVLVAGMALAERSGNQLDARRGLVWGLCGFVAFQLAPAFGLPPEVPGAAHIDLGARQLWWYATAIATTAGLGLIAFGRGAIAWVIAVLLLLAPHLYGAPAADAHAGAAPPELAAGFAARALGIGMAAWSILGAILGATWNRTDET